MPLFDSFTVDHTKLSAPAVRLAKTILTPKGHKITVFDLRFCKPNVEILPERGLHTLEHLYAGFMRDRLSVGEIIDISPMGCRTGFYMSVLGEPLEKDVVLAWMESMELVLKVKDESSIPELNEYQCGTFNMHSLNEAKEIAKSVLDRGIGIMSNEELKLDASFLKS